VDGLDELDGMDVVTSVVTTCQGDSPRASGRVAGPVDLQGRERVIIPQAAHQRLTIVNVAVLAFDALPDGSVAVSVRR
jgi:hypothetical protein